MSTGWYAAMATEEPEGAVTQLYIDDLYVFAGDGRTVFVMDVNSNITGVYAEPGFHPEARYEFKVHFGGADFEALTYRVSFGGPDADGWQALPLHALAGSQALTLVNGAVAQGTAPDLSGWRPQDARNSFAGTTVESIVLEVAHSQPRRSPPRRQRSPRPGPASTRSGQASPASRGGRQVTEWVMVAV